MSHSNYLPHEMGSATVSPTGEFETGSYHEFAVTYTAGKFGIDDTGAIKLVHRFASDMGKPQLTDPKAANYVTAEASNGAILHIEFDGKRNIRPWDKTIYIKVVRGFLREGDQITIRLGDRRGGGPGIRMQTFCEDTFEFRLLIDAIATYNFVELPEQPIIKLISGPPVIWKAIIPTSRTAGSSFSLSMKGEDKWGNPSNQCDQIFSLRSDIPVVGLPESIAFKAGEKSFFVRDLKVEKPGDVFISMVDSNDVVVAQSNPLRVVGGAELLPYWADLHGQSEETIGTNSARDFHAFARDNAFLDAVAHQGNDFQITTPFWNHLNELTAEFNEDGKFIAFPGYEWSGNTGMGGDRNVLFMEEGRQIHRSSHALIEDLSDEYTDAHTAVELFEKLEDEDCVVFAHIGGRYADIKMAHDDKLERAVEVHSAWGTFEWLIHDAFEKGYRVGIVSNSDGHKGRPGASHPGATSFGSYGGLTCMLAKGLSRSGLLESLRTRHHYGTTGCRMVLNVNAVFEGQAELFSEDPNMGNCKSEMTSSAMMGDILKFSGDTVNLNIDLVGSSPIERVEIRNGLETIETFRPYAPSDLGKRIRVIWEGSEYRGRGRETHWDGSVELNGNRFERVEPINRYNVDKKFDQVSDSRLEWGAITTGGFGGFDAWLSDEEAGMIKIKTNLIKQEIIIKDIGQEDLVFENGGINRRIRVFRMPNENLHYKIKLERSMALSADRDNALYVCITQEDGHLIWSSPIYIFKDQ